MLSLTLLFAIVSFLIAAVAFGYSAGKLFRKKKPMYLQILACAAGCFALQQLCVVVNLWCGVTSAANLGMFGIFGCNFFLLSANFGTLVQSAHPLVGFVLPVITFIPVVILLHKTKSAEREQKAASMK